MLSLHQEAVKSQKVQAAPYEQSIDGVCVHTEAALPKRLGRVVWPSPHRVLLTYGYMAAFRWAFCAWCAHRAVEKCWKESHSPQLLLLGEYSTHLAQQ